MINIISTFKIRLCYVSGFNHEDLSIAYTLTFSSPREPQGKEIYDAVLNQTNVGDNNNKFYAIQVLGSYFEHHLLDAIDFLNFLSDFLYVFLYLCCAFFLYLFPKKLYNSGMHTFNSFISSLIA